MSVQAGTLPVSQPLFAQQQAPMAAPFGMPSPHPQGLHPQPGIAAHAATQVVSEVTLRVVSAALATISEQVRIDPQALQSLCAQGQLSPQAYSNVLVAAAQRTAPVVAAALGAITSGAVTAGAVTTGVGTPSIYGTPGHTGAWGQPFGVTPYGTPALQHQILQQQIQPFGTPQYAPGIGHLGAMAGPPHTAGW